MREYHLSSEKGGMGECLKETVTVFIHRTSGE